ncbi:VOC family protein [Marinitenerispora sediminis]|uniref:Bleomycin resistance protein n=1 Tax=Marinitenerispora sediminis TaxID=1931232 RepID=A0A368T1F9_9ACTN|nr:VOC family protein [Marinitenerispora sediminis]RCV52780.1 bleomycin resistance protein [Marinitenerispora sediminis]RCV53741.1 bleomycin resistance protein [Marinitenerispora sediminis]RCV54075.1 bleomycin resistance protein [Marinitenerispora sediminis]
MAISLNHTIVPSRDKHAAAAFLADLLGLPVGRPVGPFVPLQIGDSVTLDFADSGESGPMRLAPHHYAFEVGEQEFDQIFERIVAAGLRYYARPHEPKGYGEINTERGGRTVYFDDPNGHVFEVLTSG